jgi:NAD(P)-dependent dehydrogenase (short-subunit alcohol dehydrogenase family)
MKLKTRINPSSVFVVSGGAKGITAQCVIRLAELYQCKWILLGRSELTEVEPTWARDYSSESELKRRIMENFLAQNEKPTPIQVRQVYQQIISSREIRKTLARLKQLGSQAEYLSVDVTDAPTLQTKLAVAVKRLGAIAGIIHGAGNLADKWIENKTEEDFDKVYAAKVKGLENLLSCVPASQLEYLILFSSVAGFFGNVGQSDYALANEILNKSAHLVKQHNPHCHVVSINWGPWDSGMVTPELKQVYAQRNIEVIPIEVGTQMLVDELSATYNETAQVLIGSPLTPPAEELDSELRTYRICRRLTLEANPFLQDHVIGGNPVLPATCAASWIISTCEQLHPGYKFFSLEKFKVLKGIVFDNTQANEFFVDVREVAKNNASEVMFEVSIWSDKEKGKIRFHYSGQVILQQKTPPPPIHESFNPISEQIIPGFSFYQNKTLFHGSSFQGVESVLKLNEKALIMTAFLPEIKLKNQGQFWGQNFNSFTTDVVIQSLLIWTQDFCQSASLPSEIEQITQFKTIPFNERFYVFMDVCLKTDTHVIASVTADDEQGKIYAHLSGVKFTISRRLNNFFRQIK